MGIHSSSIQSTRLVFLFFLSLFCFTPYPNHESLHNAGYLTDTSLPRPHARRELAPEQDHTQRQGLLSTVAGNVFFISSFVDLFYIYSTPLTARIPKHRVHVSFIDLCRASCPPQAVDQSPCICAGGDFGSVGVGGRGGCVWVVE